MINLKLLPFGVPFTPKGYKVLPQKLFPRKDNPGKDKETYSEMASPEKPFSEKPFPYPEKILPLYEGILPSRLSSRKVSLRDFLPIPKR